MSKLFSIITVVKNSIDNIAVSVESVLSQSFQNYEYIIVDGKSSDGTDFLIKHKYISQSKIRFYSNNDASVYDGLNFAIKKAKGNYVILLHAGDILAKSNTLLEISEKISNKEDYLIGNIAYYNSNFMITRKWEINSNLDINNFYKIPHTGLVIKRNIFKQIIFDKSYKISADIKFIIKLLALSKNYKILNMNILFMNNSGLSTNFKTLRLKIHEDLKILYEEYKLIFIFIYMKKIFYKINQLIFKNEKNYQLIKIISDILFNLDKKKIYFYLSLNKKIFLLNKKLNINLKKNFVLSGFNMACISSLINREIFLHKNLIHWNDGISGEYIIPQISKIAGRNLIRKIKLDKNIKRIVVVGNSNQKILSFLKKKFLIKYKAIVLPFSENMYYLSKFITEIKKNDIIFITIATPKQERLAQYLMQKFKYCKVMCLGGALNIAAGVDKEVPVILDKLKLEWFWRLKNETFRRLIRLFRSLFFLISNYEKAKQYQYSNSYNSQG